MASLAAVISLLSVPILNSSEVNKFQVSHLISQGAHGSSERLTCAEQDPSIVQLHKSFGKSSGIMLIPGH